MKVKHTIIPFIPISIVMIALKLMSFFGLDSNGTFLGMNKMNIIYAVIGLTLILFLVCVLINLFDRKTSPVYPVKRNIPAGVLAVLSGAAIIVSSLLTFVNTTANSEYYFMTMICAVLSIPAGIALMVMSKSHFTGKTEASALSMLFVFPSLWGCSKIVFEFLIATKVSISATDLTLLFCYIFITLFLFSDAMVLSRIKGRNPVKANFIYGFPAAAVSLAYGADRICTALIEEKESLTMLPTLMVAAELLLIALYIISFLTEMTRVSYTKDDIEIIDGIEEEEEYNRRKNKARFVDTEDYDSIAFSSRDEREEENEQTKDSYQGKENIDDFIIGYAGNAQDDEPVPYLTKDEMKNSINSQVVIPGAQAEPYTPIDNNDSLVEDIMGPGDSDGQKPQPEQPEKVKSSEELTDYIVGSAERDSVQKPQSKNSEAASNDADDYIMPNTDAVTDEVSSQKRRINSVGSDELVENIMNSNVYRSEDNIDEINRLLQNLEDNT